MPSKRRCSYCGSDDNLTREHIIPKFIYSREALKGHETPVSHVPATAGEKFVQSEPVIADVCARCNNGVLSRLDEYGAKMYDQFFDVTPQPGERIELSYDFDLLTRWLLKLAYNTARMRKWPAPHFEQLEQATEYISGKASCPTNLRIYVQLITPAKLTPQQKQRVIEGAGEVIDEVEPGFRRFVAFAGRGMIAGCLVGMNGFQFYIVFWDHTRNRRALKNFETKFLRHTRGSKWLPSTTSKSIVYPSSVNILDVVESNPLMLRNIERGAAWVEQRFTNTHKRKQGSS
jgi:hypothetical protein